MEMQSRPVATLGGGDGAGLPLVYERPHSFAKNAK
jgi:hypothetical protein